MAYPPVPGVPGGMQPQMQALPRAPTGREIREAKRKQRLNEMASFAANLLQNSIRSGDIRLCNLGAQKAVTISDEHIVAAFEAASSFFVAVDEMVAESEKASASPPTPLVSGGDA